MIRLVSESETFRAQIRRLVGAELEVRVESGSLRPEPREAVRPEDRHRAEADLQRDHERIAENIELVRHVRARMKEASIWEGWILANGKSMEVKVPIPISQGFRSVHALRWGHSFERKSLDELHGWELRRILTFWDHIVGHFKEPFKYVYLLE